MFPIQAARFGRTHTLSLYPAVCPPTGEHPEEMSSPFGQVPVGEQGEGAGGLGPGTPPAKEKARHRIEYVSLGAEVVFLPSMLLL